jgi:hypothetical protein
MDLPQPIPGLVIRYSYLWREEHEDGLEEGRKDRPCAIVVAIRAEDGETRILVLPVTHSEPTDKEAGIEMPAPVKARLGLDASRSWIVVTEYNEFIWPGPDLRRATDGVEGSVAFGVLPPGLFATVRQALLRAITKGAVASVPRTS